MRDKLSKQGWITFVVVVKKNSWILNLFLNSQGYILQRHQLTLDRVDGLESSAEVRRRRIQKNYQG